MAFTLALVFRVALVESWRDPGGDGIQYYRLAQTLRAHGLLAPSHLPGHLSYSRMPGYPLFLAYISVRKAPFSLEGHVKRATRTNVGLDLITAGLVAAMALHLRRRLGGRSGDGIALAGFGAIVLAPPMWILASYALTESFATLLATLELGLALLLLDGRRLYTVALLTGIVAGVNQLVRADALSFAPAVAIAIYAAPVGWKARLRAVGIIVGVAATIFAPWPIRNLRTFGRPYPFATYWRTVDMGRPLPMGFIEWARTWASGQKGESYLDYAIAQETLIGVDFPGLLRKEMYDSPEERRRLRALLGKYNEEMLSPAVDAGFSALAAERRARRPFASYVQLPLLRTLRLFQPVPYAELPMKVRWLGLGENRIPWCAAWDYTLYLLALLGVASLLRRRETWALCAIFVVPIVFRALVLGYTVALGGTERHMVEIHPFLVLLAIIGVMLRGRAADSLARPAQRPPAPLSSSGS